MKELKLEEYIGSLIKEAFKRTEVQYKNLSNLSGDIEFKNVIKSGIYSTCVYWKDADDFNFNTDRSIKTIYTINNLLSEFTIKKFNIDDITDEYMQIVSEKIDIINSFLYNFFNILLELMLKKEEYVKCDLITKIINNIK